LLFPPVCFRCLWIEPKDEQRSCLVSPETAGLVNKNVNIVLVFFYHKIVWKKAIRTEVKKMSAGGFINERG